LGEGQLNGVFDNSIILGIPLDNPEITPKEECRYDVCVVMNKDFNVERPAHIGGISGGKYADFLLDLTKETVSESWCTIFY
jgi:DNA gyrase inhibitor GyrI